MFPFVFKLWRYHDLPAPGDIPAVVRKDPPSAAEAIAPSLAPQDRYQGQLHRLWEERYRILSNIPPHPENAAGFQKILCVDDGTAASAAALEAARLLAVRWSVPAVESHVMHSAEEAIALATRESAGLIVVGEAVQTLEERVKAGNSLAEALVKEADRPVLVVRPGAFRRNLQKILVPVDATPASLAPVAEALRWARLFASELLVLHVEERAGTSLKDETEHEAFLKILDGARWGSTKHETLRGHGTVGTAIVECAREEDVDLIVMGTHRAAIEGEILPQSQALEVLRGITSPVLVLHPYA